MLLHKLGIGEFFMFTKNLCVLLITLFALHQAKAEQNVLTCSQLQSLKTSLNSIKRAQDFNTSNPKVKEATNSLNKFFITLLSAKSDAESDKMLGTIRKCLGQSVTSSKAQETKSLISKLVQDMTDFEKESFSLVEVVCAGFSVKELVAFSGSKAVAAGAASTATAAAAAAVGGWVLGETILLVDSQTGSHFQSSFAKYIVNPIVKKLVGGPSEKDLVVAKSNEFTSAFLLNFKNKKFSKKA